MSGLRDIRFVCICSKVYLLPDIVGYCASLILLYNLSPSHVDGLTVQTPPFSSFTSFWITFLKNTYISHLLLQKEGLSSPLSEKKSFFLKSFFIDQKGIKNSEQKYSSRGCSFWVYVFSVFSFSKARPSLIFTIEAAEYLFWKCQLNFMWQR